MRLFRKNLIALALALGVLCLGADTNKQPESKGNKNQPNGYAGLDSSGKVSTAQLPTMSSGSARILYASATCALDSNLSSGGGTDDTTALQAILDQATTLTQLHVIVERPARITNTLRIRGNTTLEFLPGAGIYLTSGSNTDMLTNYNRSSSTITDKNIRITGGFFNGNGAGQATTHTLEGIAVSVIGIWFSGVDNITIQDVTIYEAKRFALYFNNATHGVVNNYRAEWVSRTNQNLNDGVHFNGPIDNFALRDIWHNGGDDAIGLNSDELSGGTFPSFMSSGGINNVLVDGVTLNGSCQGVRVLNQIERSDNITIRNVKGTVMNYAVGINYTFSAGTGNLGNILVEDVSVTHVTGGDASQLHPECPTWCTIGVSARTDSLVIRNVRDNAPFDLRPLIYFTGGVATTRAVFVDGISVANRSAGNGDVIAGTATPISLMASNVVTAGKLTALTTTSTSNISEATVLAKYNLADTTDASGNGYTLTSTPTVTFAAGKVGNAATFDGSNGHLDSTTLDLSGASFSIAGWIKLVGGTVKVAISQYGEGTVYGQRWLLYHNTDNTLHFGVQRSDNSFPEAVSSALSTGAWHFFAVTYNSGTGAQRISVDGGSWVTNSSNALAMRSTNPHPPFTFGTDHEGTGGSGSGSSNCSLDAVVVYRHVMSDAERDALYNGGSGTE